MLGTYDMDASSHPQATNARNSEAPPRNWMQAFTTRLASSNLETIADAVNKDVSSASRIRAGETRVTINEAMAIVSAIGLKIVDATSVCVRREQYDAIAAIAGAAMADREFSRRLVFDE